MSSHVYIYIYIYTYRHIQVHIYPFIYLYMYVFIHCQKYEEESWEISCSSYRYNRPVRFAINDIPFGCMLIMA